MQESCSIEGCERIHYAKGWCKYHYMRQPARLANEQRYRADPDVKTRRRISARRRYAKTQAYRMQWAQRKSMPRWAAWWEQQRRTEDIADLAWPAISHGHGATRISARPKTRQFIAGWCVDCDQSFLVVRGWWHGSTRCSRCTQRHWNCGDHCLRARKYGVAYEPIDPLTIFQRDSWKCQICGRRTKGTYPEPRAPSLDHIVPMALGGPHVESNVQCACWDCNCRKGSRSANDQLRLALV